MGEYTVMMENALFSEPDVIDDYEAATKAFLDCDELCRTFVDNLLGSLLGKVEIILVASATVEVGSRICSVILS